MKRKMDQMLVEVYYEKAAKLPAAAAAKKDKSAKEQLGSTMKAEAK
jgi:hypothetical protein